MMGGSLFCWRSGCRSDDCADVTDVMLPVSLREPPTNIWRLQSVLFTISESGGGGDGERRRRERRQEAGGELSSRSRSTEIITAVASIKVFYVVVIVDVGAAGSLHLAQRHSNTKRRRARRDSSGIQNYCMWQRRFGLVQCDILYFWKIKIFYDIVSYFHMNFTIK